MNYHWIQKVDMDYQAVSQTQKIKTKGKFTCGIDSLVSFEKKEKYLLQESNIL